MKNIVSGIPESLHKRIMLESRLTHCIIWLTKWKLCLEQDLVFGVLIVDLSKAFDSLSQMLLALKLNKCT